jgi:hypothetical protein
MSEPLYKLVSEFPDVLDNGTVDGLFSPATPQEKLADPFIKAELARAYARGMDKQMDIANLPQAIVEAAMKYPEEVLGAMAERLKANDGLQVTSFAFTNEASDEGTGITFWNLTPDDLKPQEGGGAK